MPIATATRPQNTGTDTSSRASGICAAEADLITATARRFLTRTSTASPDTAIATLTAHITALTHPYTPASIDDYNCEKPNNTHWCSSR